jgi:hypothetical protein
MTKPGTLGRRTVAGPRIEVTSEASHVMGVRLQAVDDREIADAVAVAGTEVEATVARVTDQPIDDLITALDAAANAQPKRSMLSSSPGVVEKNAMVDRSVVTSCAYTCATTSPRWQCWKVAV